MDPLGQDKKHFNCVHFIVQCTSSRPLKRSAAERSCPRGKTRQRVLASLTSMELHHVHRQLFVPTVA